VPQFSRDAATRVAGTTLEPICDVAVSHFASSIELGQYVVKLGGRMLRRARSGIVLLRDAVETVIKYR
jgi:hypothetical protein